MRLPRIWIDLLELLLMHCDRLAVLVEDEEARACRALINAADEYFFASSHVF